MSSIIAPLLASGKESHSLDTSNIRCVLPKLCIAGIVHVLLSLRLHHFADRYFPLLLGPSMYIGARPKTQVMEIAFGVQLALEKMLDDRSNGCCVQADVKQYFDPIGVLSIANWLEAQHFPKSIIAAIIRQQLTQLIFRHDKPHACAENVSRNKALSTLTGFRVAGALARIPIVALALAHVDAWRQHLFHAAMSMASWLDNLLFMGRTYTCAMEMAMQFEIWLRENWNIDLKPTSKKVCLPPNHEPVDIPTSRSQVDILEVLGYPIS